MSDPGAFSEVEEFLGALTAWGNLVLEQALRAVTETGGNDPLERLARAAGPSDQDLTERIEAGWTSLRRRSVATMEAGHFIPWIHLSSLFQLDRAEQTILLLALLPSLDQRYGAVLAQLGGAENAGYLPLRTFAAVVGRPVAHRALAADAPLRQWEFLESAPDAAAHSVTPFAPDLRLSPLIAAYLRAEAAPQPQLDHPLETLAPAPALDQLPLMTATRSAMERLLSLWHAPDPHPRGFVLLAQGQDKVLLEQLCSAGLAEVGLTGLRVDGRELLRMAQDGRPLDAVLGRLRVLCRDALLCNHALVLDNSQWLIREQDDESLLQAVLQTILASQRQTAVINGPLSRLTAQILGFAAHPVLPAVIRLEPPDAALRLAVWQAHCAAQGLTVASEVVERLADTAPLSAHQIEMAVRDAASRAVLTDQPVDALLAQAAHDQGQSNGLSVAQEVRSRYRLDDIVLAVATRQALDLILVQVRQRHRVIDQWGFDALTDNPLGMCVLFHGPSGTGKTMAASVIANELGLSLYKVDLSSVLSKYIGETEKHLAQLFDQAEAMNVVLFFDEAESLFARRTETKDSHDRYANLQTGYLLQRVERYAGTVILSTNLLKNLDQAFTRRFRFIIEFPFPGPDERLRLWQKAFPAAAPMDSGVVLAPLAEALALSGGNIKSVALAAAFQAASQDQPITMDHIRHACECEYEKMGKIFPGFGLINDD